MPSSCRIWIPSKQNYERILEITCEQYRSILKSIDDDEDFDYQLNELLIQNLVDRSIELNDYTIIDRFIIFLQLKIHSYNSNLKLIRICDKCETKTEFNIDLNRVIESLAPSLDKSFKSSFNLGTMTIICDAPNIQVSEYRFKTSESIDEKLEKYLYSFITEIRISDVCIRLADRTESERITICNSIPYEVMYKIKTEYVDIIHNTFKDLLLITNNCSNTKCNDKLILNFDISNMTDAIKVLFKDDSAINMLGQYANVSSKCHFDYGFYKNITPLELSIVYDMVVQSEATPEDKEKTNKEIDLFEQYRSETEGMVETPSEFK